MLLEAEPPVAWLTFNRPEARNAMTWPMYDGLVKACDWADSQPELRVLLLTGAGEHAFVAGTDIAQFKDFRTAQDALDYEAKMEGVVGRLARVRCATIAVIRGYAVGAGAAIAMACDLRVCATDLQFGVPIARTLGNTLNMANFRRLVALVGQGRAKDLMFTARTMGAQEAQQTGLATIVTAPEDLKIKAESLAKTIAGNAPLTIQASKEAIRRLAAGDPNEADLIALAYTSEDFREGVTSFLEKRKPVWRGR